MKCKNATWQLHRTFFLQNFKKYSILSIFSRKNIINLSLISFSLLQIFCQNFIQCQKHIFIHCNWLIHEIENQFNRTVLLQKLQYVIFIYIFRRNIQIFDRVLDTCEYKDILISCNWLIQEKIQQKSRVYRYFHVKIQ